MKKKILTILLILTGIILNAQDLSPEEKNIQILFDKLYFASDDNIKDSVNKIIKDKLIVELYTGKNELNFLNSIKNISYIISDDKNIQFITWTIQYSDSKFDCFGFVRYYSDIKLSYIADELIDKIDIIPETDINKYYPDNWYGAVYYNILTKKYKGNTHYIILGWDGNDHFTNKKLIDVFWLEDDEYPVFGKNIIEYKGGFVNRIIFQYGERINMNLIYDKRLNKIVWDHLSPSKQSLKGHYQYYGPDMSFDGLYFEKGVWKYIADIDMSK